MDEWNYGYWNIEPVGTKLQIKTAKATENMRPGYNSSSAIANSKFYLKCIQFIFSKLQHSILFIHFLSIFCLCVCVCIYWFGCVFIYYLFIYLFVSAFVYVFIDFVMYLFIDIYWYIFLFHHFYLSIYSIFVTLLFIILEDLMVVFICIKYIFLVK